jgi:hypothetical protein
LFIELVDVRIRTVLERWWAGAQGDAQAEAFRALGVDLDEARASFVNRRRHQS